MSLADSTFSPCGEIPLGPPRVSVLHAYADLYLKWRLKFWFNETVGEYIEQANKVLAQRYYAENGK